MNKNRNLYNIVGDSFTEYSAAVLQARALVDVRDGLKPSARQIFYCMETDKFTADKPFQKTIKAIGSAFRMYIHGDASATGIIMRAGQPFAMRYPLIEVDGSYGSLMESGNWASPRYTGSRLSPISAYLFQNLKSNVVEEWRDNYDGQEQYPNVLPSMGFYNLVNGTLGIGVGMASSIPPTNLREVNEALIKLLWNPEIDFDEIYCPPDFPTGGVILNEDEVKQSLLEGTGKSVRIRSVIDYNAQDRTLVVKEIPYGVYTNTICKQLEEILNSDGNPGVDRFNDLTGADPLIKIYLKKNANPDKVIRFLYKKTSLQSFYGINMTMLKDGRFPRVFGWRQALQEHLDHEAKMYTNLHLNIKETATNRLHIVEGLINAISIIDQVIAIIRGSATAAQAKSGLVNLQFSSAQADAILKITLGRLVNLEITKLENEQKELKSIILKSMSILENRELLYKEIEAGLVEVAKKFGDSRRTKVLNITSEDEEEPEEVVEIIINLTSNGALIPQRVSTLYTQNKNTRGIKIGLEKGEYVLDSLPVRSNQSILVFDKNGKYYSFKVRELIDAPRTYVAANACTLATLAMKKPYLIFITQKGFVKKTSIAEYTTNRKDGVSAIKLTAGDSLVNVYPIDDNQRLGILSSAGNIVIIETEPINPIGKNTRGVKGIRLDGNEFVISARIINQDDKEIFSISQDGNAKRTSITEYPILGRGSKGVRIQGNKDLIIADFLSIKNETDFLILSSQNQLRLNLADIPLSGRTAVGNRAIRLKEKEKVTNVLKI